MLQRDYILEIIAQFVEVVSRSLRRAVAERDEAAVLETEEAIAGLLDLDPQVAMQLAPDSLVTMMVLSGVGDSVASYVAYALRAVSGAYGGMGRPDKARLRAEQAEAIEESFGCGCEVPAEFEELDKALHS